MFSTTSTTLAVISFVASAFAQDAITTSIFFPQQNPSQVMPPLVASVVTADDASTVLSLRCPAEATQSECSNIARASVIATINPSEIDHVRAIANTPTDGQPAVTSFFRQICNTATSTAIPCTITGSVVDAAGNTASLAGGGLSQTTTYNSPSYYPVTILAGAEEVSVATGAPVPSPAPTGGAADRLMGGSVAGVVGAIAAVALAL